MTTILSTPSRVIPPRARVAYCSNCLIYLEEAEVGRLCPLLFCNHKLRLRVGYICRDCECQNIFFNKDDFLHHRCEDYGP